MKPAPVMYTGRPFPPFLSVDAPIQFHCTEPSTIPSVLEKQDKRLTGWERWKGLLRLHGPTVTSRMSERTRWPRDSSDGRSSGAPPASPRVAPPCGFGTSRTHWNTLRFGQMLAYTAVCTSNSTNQTVPRAKQAPHPSASVSGPNDLHEPQKHDRQPEHVPKLRPANAHSTKSKVIR